jgi:hypothetical protein
MLQSIGHWFAVPDGTPRARWLYERHYSCVNLKARRRRPKRNLIVGPGEKMVLLTSDGLALFVWRKFRSGDGQQGVNCATFRNEGPYLSSELILEAEALAWERWPGERLYTYVNGLKVKSSNPGWCFQCAGWKKCGVSKGGLIILEKMPLIAGM